MAVTVIQELQAFTGTELGHLLHNRTPEHLPRTAESLPFTPQALPSTPEPQPLPRTSEPHPLTRTPDPLPRTPKSLLFEIHFNTFSTTPIIPTLTDLAQAVMSYVLILLYVRQTVAFPNNCPVFSVLLLHVSTAERVAILRDLQCCRTSAACCATCEL
jgi:hypothetical protein